MKVQSILAISLAATSFSCLAFKSQANVTNGPSTTNIIAVESKILGSFYSQHGASPQTTSLGTCDASPVSGCSCPYCTMLRSRAG